jgi:hypothetical protein
MNVKYLTRYLLYRLIDSYVYIDTARARYVLDIYKYLLKIRYSRMRTPYVYQLYCFILKSLITMP